MNDKNASPLVRIPRVIVTATQEAAGRIDSISRTVRNARLYPLNVEEDRVVVDRERARNHRLNRAHTGV